MPGSDSSRCGTSWKSAIAIWLTSTRRQVFFHEICGFRKGRYGALHLDQQVHARRDRTAGQIPQAGDLPLAASPKVRTLMFKVYLQRGLLDMSPTAEPCFSRAVLSAGLVAVCLTLAGDSHAAIQTQPTSLNPGDQYRLVFITSNARNAAATDINVYNSFVSAAANAVPELASLLAEWKVIGATHDINARQNTGTDPTPLGATGVPIFLLNDTRIAANYDDLWDGVLENHLNITENGQVTDWNSVWTGSGDNGFDYAVQNLGDFAPLYGDPTPAPGGPTTNVDGDRNGWMFDWAAVGTLSAPFYAMSSVLTVPGDPNVVPEATSVLTWLGLSLAAVVGGSLRRNRQS
jgi:hypothetical protein